MPAPSLVESCTKACIKNIRSLTDVGDFEYWKIRTVLQRIDSSEQLHQIELNSPQIRGETEELWHALIARDIPNWRDKRYRPKNPLKWYEVYCKYKKEQNQEIARDEEILRNTMLGIKKERETHVSKVVDLRTLPKVPRDPRMLANNGGVPLGKNKGFAKPSATTLTWNAGSRTKLTDGKSVLTRARREAKEISQRSKLARPMNDLGGRAGQVRKAPAGMINEYRKAAEPPLRILSRKHRDIGKISGGISGPSLEDRERRLRALTGGSGPRGNISNTLQDTLVGSSDEEVSGADTELDDLFDESSKPRSRPILMSPPRALGPLSHPSKLPSSRPRTNTLSSSKPQISACTLQNSHSSSNHSSPPKASDKPSDLISSIISRSKPAPGTSRSPIPRTSAERSETPNSASGTPRPMMRKRVEVDVFNRGSAKRPRVR